MAKFKFLFNMKVSSSNKTVEIIIKLIIAIASAVAGALGYSGL